MDCAVDESTCAVTAFPMMDPIHNSSIGVLDSGSGGLTIWQALTEQLPFESITYVGDHAYLPYGAKTTAFITKRVYGVISFLQRHGAKLIVIACNTATVAGIDKYRKMFPDIPIVGVVPVIKTATQQSRTKCFAILSTELTAKSAYQKNLIREYANGFQVFNLYSNILVPLIESGKTEGLTMEVELGRVLAPIKDSRADIVVLGCTHFPFIRGVCTKILGDDIQVLDSSGAVGRQVRRILERNNMLSPSHGHVYTFYTTGDAIAMTRLFSRLLQKSAKVDKIEL